MNAPAPIFDPEDPRLTAYALGELTDPADHAAVEQTLRSSPEARAALQEIRSLTAALVAEYEQERLLAAGDGAAPSNVVSMDSGAPTAPRSWPRRLWLAAAAVLLLASVAPLMMPRWHTAVHPPESALHSSTAAVGSIHVPADAKAFPAAPVTATDSPMPSFSGSIADVNVGRDVTPADDFLHAPSDASASRLAGSAMSARGSLAKDDAGQMQAAKSSKALALDVPPLSQGGLEGAPVASAPSIVSRSVSRRTAALDKRREAQPAPPVENSFIAARDHPLSTFLSGASTASYADARRFIASGRLPPPDAVRAGEWINAFPCDDPAPAPGDARPFAVRLEAASCPWNPQDRLVRVGIVGREAGDVETRVEFNPAAVAAYRLIGAGEDANHRRSALYEVVPADRPVSAGPSLTVKPPYTAADGDRRGPSDEASLINLGAPGDLPNASPDFKFAAAVASCAQILGNSPYRGDATLDAAIALARQGIGNDPDGRRADFVELVRQAQILQKTRDH